ncbi:hypothetical protein, partial [uncultured Thiodictyon sp.]|uniref:hypothetical protein n=1 Tax=uncultured Thiodictyon sp. TaxID=1846217 RepID=UPI0025CDD7F0
MMSGAGHDERQSEIPAPLAAGSVLARIGTLGLPATLLSWVSLLALLFVLVTVQSSAALRSHYTLVLVPPWVAAVGAAALAWAIVSAGRRRPGPLWPRLWALALAVGTSLTAGAALLSPAWLPAPQLHALAIATLAGVLALAPRLARIHPDSDWTTRVAPLSLLFTLCLILPLALAQRQGTGAATVDAAIDALSEAQQVFSQAGDFQWSRLPQRLPEAGQVVARLRALPPDPLPADPALWASAAALGRAPQLTAAAQRLMRTIADGLNPDRPDGFPRLSALGLGAADLGGPSQIVGDYFEQVGRRFHALDPARRGATAGPLPGAYAKIASDFAGFLRTIGDRWSDAWAVAMIPERLRLGVSADLSPRALLGKALFGDYQANDIPRLWGIDLATARRLQPGGRNDCGGLAFEQPKREYRIDCFAYAPAAAGRTAEVLAEVRIVYAARAGDLSEHSLPAQIWYSFALP